MSDGVAPVVYAVAGRQDLTDREVGEVLALLVDLVVAGAALGWVDPPSKDEIRGLLMGVAEDVETGNAALCLARADDAVVGFGYWRRYVRQTTRVQADLERVAVRADQQRRGLGKRLTSALLEQARSAAVEQVTLDLRADNTAAITLYASLGFREYGRLPGFVAVGDRRYDRILCVRDLRAG